MKSWADDYLESLLTSPEYPMLHVSCGDAGEIKVVGVKHIEGFVSIGVSNQGYDRHLFDLSFDVVFKAVWLSDIGSMASKGTVHVEGFANTLRSVEMQESHRDDDTSVNICGMDVDFAEEVADDNHRR